MLGTKGDSNLAEKCITGTNWLEAEARQFKLEIKHAVLTVRVNSYWDRRQREMVDSHRIQIFKSRLDARLKEKF